MAWAASTISPFHLLPRETFALPLHLLGCWRLRMGETKLLSFLSFSLTEEDNDSFIYEISELEGKGSESRKPLWVPSSSRLCGALVMGSSCCLLSWLEVESRNLAAVGSHFVVSCTLDRWWCVLSRNTESSHKLIPFGDPHSGLME